MQFSHLHNHTQFSLLDGASDINRLFKKAQADNQPAMAITDHGNMFGVFEFVAAASKYNVKPIVGCEFYVVEDHTIKQFTKEKKDRRFHQLLLAKNKVGYHNLTKLCSLGYIEGLYGKYPRITKALIEKYKEGLIATTCCLGAMVPQTILKKGEEEGEKEFLWWFERFGEDYYVELQRHDIPDQLVANEVLLKFAAKYGVKVIASNDSHYVDRDDWVAHDVLLCVNTNEKLSTPSAKDFNDDDSQSSKGTRFAFYNDQFYFKTAEEMTVLFKDIPQAIDNTNEIVGKIEPLKLKQDILLPNFPIPDEFKIHPEDTLNQWEYLKHLTYEGAKKRYGDLLPEVQERLDFELFTVRTMGFAGYFLIVADFIKAGRDLGVMIGPGRGSAAGSAVAYCIGITNIDPIKYNLLFERFLNPDRKSMPDIDTDFDDEGRQKVIDYVVKKYGRNQVAQIVTYGTMASKSSIKDVARVMELPLNESNALAKLVPDKPTYGMTLKKVFENPLTGEGSLAALLQTPEELENVKKLRELEQGDDLTGKVLRQARKLEGNIRNTGIHAAGIIIAPYDLTDILPVATSKETELLITQFEGKIIEDAGVIKMDFLGLRNLTIIKDCLRMIQENHGVWIEIDEIPLDDKKTYELFQRGETNAIFQFESDGMKKYLKDLKPDRFDDLIAMNALYRPGPLAYIPSFINRKHGREEIQYDVPEMEEYLADTFGICVTGDTKIHNPLTGEHLRIDELQDKVGSYYVQGVNENLETVFAPITHWVCNGVKEVFEVKLHNGSSVKMTSNHKVLTEDGWKELKDIHVGEYIATPQKLELENTSNFNRSKLRVLAYLLADGALSGAGSTAEFISKDDVLIDAYKNDVMAFERLETTTLMQVRDVTRVMVRGTNKTKYHETNSLVQFLRDEGLKTMKGGCTSETKFIPDFVFTLSDDDISFFLATIWDCDGYIGEKLCFVKTISKDLAIAYQTLLLRLGISSSIYESYYFNNRHQEQKTAYQVTVYNLLKFSNLIAPHLLLKSIKQETNLTGNEKIDSVSRSIFTKELLQEWAGSKRGLMDKYGFDRQHLHTKAQTRPRIAKNAIQPLLNDFDLQTTKRNLQVRWEQIVSITPLGNELVYDITVDKIHNFVGNNVILHNCVYQEQIMLLSQKLADFTKGDADVLRKAMGKKQKEVLDKMKAKFIAGCEAKNLDIKRCEKVWTDWEAFASYAFNKSHSTCYAFVAYQTAYLKAHYPAEYMASVLTSSLGNIEKITFFMEECKSIGVKVLGPDINESNKKFSVNKKGEIRFGLGGIKGSGDAAVDNIIEIRENGHFKDIFDFMTRVNLRTVNKKTLESLAYSGTFDCYPDLHRAMYFSEGDGGGSLIEKLIKYANNYHQNIQSSQNSLFGGSGGEMEISRPKLPPSEPWGEIEKLKYEKEVVGFYISGHPLDEFAIEMQRCSPLESVLENSRDKEAFVGGVVSDCQFRTAKNGNPFGIFKIEDYTGTLEIALFGKDFVEFSKFFEVGRFLYLRGKVQAKWGRADEYEFKPLTIELLNEVREKIIKEIRISVDLQLIDSNFIKEINTLVEKNVGNCNFTVHIFDAEERLDVSLLSRKTKVAPTNELYKTLKEMSTIEKVSFG